MKKARRWIAPLARAGYGARGLVYLIISFFAVVAALGAGEEVDARGALDKLLTQPFGTGLIWAMIAGLAGYVIWRLVQALLDTDEHGLDPKGLAVRAGLLVSASAYATLAVYAVSRLQGRSGSGSGGGDEAGGEIASFLEALVGGHWVNFGLAVIFAGVAGAHRWKAGAGKYAPHFEAGDSAMKLVHPVSIAGLVARGFVFAVLAVLTFYRFLTTGGDPNSSPGLKEALRFVQGLALRRGAACGDGAGADRVCRLFLRRGRLAADQPGRASG